jgi:hypothetical protein
MKTQVIASLLLASFLAVSAQAQQVVTYFASVPQSTTNWTRSLQLPQFDPALGTLSQVKLLLDGEVWQSLFGENMSAGSSSYDFTTTATFKLDRSGGPTLLTTVPLVFNRAGPIGGFDGGLDFGGTSGVTFDQHALAQSGTYIDLNHLDYIGLGNCDFIASASGVSSLISGGNFAKSATTSAAASIGVEYTYAPIPEPSTYAALLGAVALTFVTIRKRRVASLD